LSEQLYVTVTRIDDHVQPIVIETEEEGELRFKRGMEKNVRAHALRELSRCERDGTQCPVRIIRQPSKSGGVHTLLGVERFK
jgi:hypothetical protein